jgi:acetylornithine/N-succinyldiaminopimelate aminotransferase
LLRVWRLPLLSRELELACGAADPRITLGLSKKPPPKTGGFDWCSNGRPLRCHERNSNMITVDPSSLVFPSLAGRDCPEPTRRRPDTRARSGEDVGGAPLMPVVKRPPLVMQRGEGSYLWDEDGRRYLDFLQGWAVNALGHSPPEVQAALAEQSSLLLTPSPAFHNRPAIELARLLVSLTGAAQVCFMNSGAEANETAIKLARKWGRKYKRGAFGIVTTHGAFHGRTLAAMAASGKPGWDELFPPYPPGFVRVPFGDLAAMERAIEPSTVALMLEPIQGEAGVVLPPAGYLKGLRELADRHDLLLLLDEVQTGVGRTGRFLAQEHEGVRADVTTLGKGLGAGLPVSAVLAGERAACFDLGDNGSTHGGNPLSANVALAVCRVIAEPAFLRRVEQRGRELARVLHELCESWQHAVARGAGLLQAIVMKQPLAEPLTERARDEGLLVNAARPTIIRLAPMLRVSEAEIRDMARRLARAHARL